jgi:CRISPR-associated endonuclease/helicase Cas3
VDHPIFQRFLPAENRDEKISPEPGTVFLVCTSAGEVGVNISADHMACDLSTFESMAQRFGRVNRFGNRNDTRVDVVYPTTFDEKDKLTPPRQATLQLLTKLNGNGSPKAISELLSALTDGERDSAFAPEPQIPVATDILFDAWALTTIRKPMPGRPPAAPYLHGLEEWQPPETYVAWRDEVEIISGELLDRYTPESLLEAYPLKPQELLRDRSDRVFDKLQIMAQRNPNLPVWVLDEQGNVLRDPRFARPLLLGEIADPSATQAPKKKALIDKIADRIVLLPPTAGGLSRGMLDGESAFANDVSKIDDPKSERRTRVWSDDTAPPELDRMRLVRSIVVEEDDDGEPRSWNWYKQKPFEDTRTAQKPVCWEVHVGDVERHTNRILSGLSFPDDIAKAIRLAAKLHDHGKRRSQFQFTLGNRTYPQLVLAKSGRAGAILPEPYRHEFGSLADAAKDTEFQRLSSEMQDLVLHLIAAHHGRARPSFLPDEVYDPDITQVEADELASEVPRRFARLQRKYGRWGLAYLESLLRSADWAASAEPSEFLQPATP